MKTIQITLKDGQTKTLRQEIQPYIEILAELGQKQVTEEHYYEMLGVLPPQAMHGGAFLVGEPNNHSYCVFSGDIAAKYDCFFSVNGLFYYGGQQSEKSFDLQFVQNYF
jgi:hypothetical protein